MMSNAQKSMGLVTYVFSAAHSAAYQELLAALQASGQDTGALALPSRAAVPPTRAALAGPPRAGGPGAPPGLQHGQAMQENRPPPSHQNASAPAPEIKREPQPAKVGYMSICSVEVSSSM